MWPVGLDLIVLAVLARDLTTLDVPRSLYSTSAVALPFFLGMAAAHRNPRGIMRLGGDPGLIRGLIASGLSLISLVLFVTHLSESGVAALFPALFGSLVLIYLVGRLAGMTLWALIVLGLLAILAASLVR